MVRSMVDAWRVADEYWSAVFEVTDGTEVWADGIHPTFVDGFYGRNLGNRLGETLTA